MTRELKTTTVRVADMPSHKRQYGMYYKLFLELREMAPIGEGKLVEFVSTKAGQRAIAVMAQAAAEHECFIFNQLHPDGTSRYIWVKTKAQAVRDGDIESDLDWADDGRQ